MILAAFICTGVYGSTLSGESSASVDTVQLVEKVYLHTDRSDYYPGDDIWFKAYLIDAYDRSLSGVSRNLHVELISPSDEIIMNRIVRLDGGLGQGDFTLSHTLVPGRYRLRAYTNYMRNFGEQTYFNKEIQITRTAAETTISQKGSEKADRFVELSFFPEGGSLVDNVTSIVAFKATDPTGRGCDVSGEIYSSAGDLITVFRSAHLGMGTFSLKPLPGLSYHALVRGPDNTETRAEIPGSFETGVTLSASVNNDNVLSVTIRTNEKTLPLVLDEDLLLSISVRKELIKNVVLRINSLASTLVIPADDLPDGIIMLTLTTPGNHPLSERLIFSQSKQDVRVNIETDKPVYKVRDQVAVKVRVSGDTISHETAYLSLSAAEGDFADNMTEFPTTIVSWFLLESDVHGPVERPSWYFDPSNQGRIRDLDLLLRTQGWRDFSWKYDSTDYFAPESGFFVSGRLRRTRNGRPLTGSKINLMILQGDKTISGIAMTDSSGGFRLDNIDLTGDAGLIATATDRNDRPDGLIELDSVLYIPSVVTSYFPSPAAVRKQEEPEYVTEEEYEVKVSEPVRGYDEREAIMKKYRLTDTIGLGEVVIASEKSRDIQVAKIESVRSFYGEPDNELIVTPLMAQSNMTAPELLMGTVAGVFVTKSGMGGYTIRIRSGATYKKDPLLLINGLKYPISYLDLLPVSMIDRIDILKSIGNTAVYGLEGNYGVISVITRSGAQASSLTETAKNSINSRISGYDIPRIFYSPVHDPAKKETFVPDLRTTLFWKPEISLTAGNEELILNYWNADNPSTIRIITEGITSTGIPVTAIAEYKVIN